MGGFTDAIGTSSKYFRITIQGPFLKILSNAAGVITGFAFRNSGDTADVPVTTSQLNNSGKTLVLNSAAANSGSDWTCAIAAPATGQTAAKTITVPARPSVPGYVVVATDTGDTWDYVAMPGITDRSEDKTYAISFNSASQINLVALPVGAIAKQITVFVDVPWVGYTAGSPPTLAIGIAGNTSLFMTTKQVDLTDPAGEKSYTVNPSVAPNASAIQMIGTYASNGATAGSGRILINYSIPSNP